MANGDTAAAAGMDVVPSTGTGGLVKNGYDEINKTRDYIAVVKNSLATTDLGWQAKAGITQGTAAPDPAVGAVGDIYFKIN